MASLKRDHRGHFILRFRTGGRGTKEFFRDLGTLSHADAKQEALKLQARFKRPAARSNPFLTFGELATMYLEERKDHLSTKGLAEADMIVRCHLIPFFGTRRVEDLRAADVEAYRRQRRRLQKGKRLADRTFEVRQTETPIAPATFNRERTVLLAVLNFGERTERVDRNPIRSGAVKRLRETPREAYFEPAEWAAFLAAAAPDPELRAAVPVLRALLLTVARIGEIVDLRWKDVDLRRKVVTVKQPKVSKAKQLPIVPELEALFPAVRGFGEALVFRQVDDRPWTVPALQSAFERILRRSGLQPEHGRPTPHSVRHTASTWAVRGGATPDEAARLRGKVSKDIYTHLQPSDLLRAAAALARIESEALHAPGVEWRAEWGRVRGSGSSAG